MMKHYIFKSIGVVGMVSGVMMVASCELDRMPETTLADLAKASLTVVKHNAVMASGGPQDSLRPSPTATAPCTSPHTSLFRQFAPELFLPAGGLIRSMI